MYFRDALRAIRKRATNSAAIILVLAAGMAAVSTAFALLYTIVLRPLPFTNAKRLVVIEHSAREHADRVGLSSGLYFHYSERARLIEDIGLYDEETLLNLRVNDGGQLRVRVTRAGAALFRVLDVKPVAGRLFTDEDGRPGFLNTRWQIPILLSYDFWIHQFGGDSSVVGRVLTINGSPREIVGVLPGSWVFPNPGTQIWMLTEPPRRTAHFARSLDYFSVATLAPGTSTASAQQELGRLIAAIEGVYPDATADRIAAAGLQPVVTPLKSAIVARIAPVLWPLFGGMLFLLTIACANSASLFMLDIERRRVELVLRRALGADDWHIARLVFIQALILASAAGFAAVLLSYAALSAVISLAPLTLPRAESIRIDRATVIFTLGLIVIVAAVYSLLASRRRMPLAAALATGDGSTGRRRGIGRAETLVALQVALAFALMVGSALMVETYRNLSRRALGFSAEGIVVVDVGLASRRASQHAAIYADLLDRIRSIPGVTTASGGSFVPLTGVEYLFPVDQGGAPVAYKFVLPGYFQTMNMRVVDGAAFDRGTALPHPSSIWVSESLARRLFPGESAVGKPVDRLDTDGSPVVMREPVPPFTIAGVVADAAELSLRELSAELVYVPTVEPSVEKSIVPTSLSYVIRTELAPSRIAAAVKQTLADQNQDLSFGGIRTMAAIVSGARATETFLSVLLVAGAAIAVLLGAAGIYASVAETVRGRTREVGIRRALGARPASLVLLVSSAVVRATLAGVGLGILVAIGASRALATLVYGVTATDPLVLTAASGLLLAAAAAASLLGAYRVVRISPLRALRRE